MQILMNVLEIVTHAIMECVPTLMDPTIVPVLLVSRTMQQLTAVLVCTMLQSGHDNAIVLSIND